RAERGEFAGQVLGEPVPGLGAEGRFGRGVGEVHGGPTLLDRSVEFPYRRLASCEARRGVATNRSRRRIPRTLAPPRKPSRRIVRRFVMTEISTDGPVALAGADGGARACRLCSRPRRPR